MVVSLVVMVIMIGILSIVAQSLSTVISSSNSAQKNASEVMLQKLWVDAVERSLRQPAAGLGYMAPIGSNLVDGAGGIYGHGFPIGIGAPSYNARSIPVHYCALSYEATAGGDVTAVLTSGLSYQIESMTINGIRYAYRTSAIPNLQRNSPNVVAFVISPKRLYSGLSCDNISYNAGTGYYNTPGFDTKVLPIIAPQVFPPAI